MEKGMVIWGENGDKRNQECTLEVLYILEVRQKCGNEQKT